MESNAPRDSEYLSLAENVKALDRVVEKLSMTDRYTRQVQTLTSIMGVGGLTAMVYLTDLDAQHEYEWRVA